MEPLTIIQQLESVFDQLDHQQSNVSGEAAREFALAKTAIEDAMMRTNRGFAKHHGAFSVGDVQAAQAVRA